MCNFTTGVHFLRTGERFLIKKKVKSKVAKTEKGSLSSQDHPIQSESEFHYLGIRNEMVA